ncbi:MAG TPA: NAD(P)/FAD-dependent oxidoreductase [Candidatus Acidoferrum sp.]|nr:NAD(P)/FAD-dependent oxidoreductase [Candidatus Acidoferrum sp.]
MIDVAIVGAGPAGLHAGRLLAQAGLDVQIFEEHFKVGTPTHCTGIVSLEVSEFVKIPDDIILNRLSVARLHGPGGASCEVPWNHASADGIVVVDRARFDEHLAEEAARAGAAIHTGAAVLSLRVERGGVRVALGDRVLHAHVVVLAAGVTYRFHRQLGLRLPPDLIHTAQVEVDAPVAPHVDLYVGRTVAPEGFVWTVPVMRGPAGRRKIGVLARGPAAMFLRRFLARPEVRARTGPPTEPPITRILPLKPVPQSYSDRILLIGDAGGFTKPTTGGGIFYSLLTASLAADTLVDAFRAGRFDAATLAVYRRRWRDRLARELSAGEWVRRAVAGCSDADLDRLVAAVGAENVSAIIQASARFNWHRQLIVTLLQEPGIGSILVRGLFGGGWRRSPRERGA